MKRMLRNCVFLGCVFALSGLSGAQTLVTPMADVNALSHSFTEPIVCPPVPEPGYVRDTWVQVGDGASFTDNLSNYDMVELRLSAGAGKKFQVQLPPGVSEVWLSVNILYRVIGQGDISNWADVDSWVIEDMVGGPVVEDYFYCYVGQNGNVIKTKITYRVQGNVSFTAVRATAAYSGGIPVPDVSKTYVLEDGGTSIGFSYSTDLTTDPGVFASIIDESEPLPGRCTAFPAMDFNRDCKVDFADLAIFADGWLECNLDPPETCW
jgi:hypothetical protein